MMPSLACRSLTLRWVVLAVLALTGAGRALAGPPSLVAELPDGGYARPVCATASGGLGTRCHAWIVTDAQGQALRQSASLSPQFVPAGLGAGDLRSAYNITGTGLSSTVIAIVDAYGYTNAEADLAVYRSQYGLPPCTTANGCFRKVNQTGGTSSYPAQDDGWAQETAVDLDMASAMCPNCQLLLIETNNANLNNLAAGVTLAASMGVHVISNSYGGPEAGTQSVESRYNHPGIAVVASSGDTVGEVDTPAAYPEVIAVGGTRLERSGNARGWTESAWSGAGAGCSAIFPKPAWQTDPDCPKRAVADVSAVADPATPVAVYAPSSGLTSAWLRFGGTSVSAPLIAGVYGVNGRPVNYARDLYDQSYFLDDVTTGSAGSCADYLCVAGYQYDGPTGLGTPYGVTPFGLMGPEVPTLPLPLLALLAGLLGGGGFVLVRRFSRAASY